MSFTFSGNLHSSKSLVNRLLILKHIFPELKLHYDSKSEDVKSMERLFSQFDQGATEFFVGEGGTTFRFFSFWISMQEGTWSLKLGKQLAARPHTQILNILNQVGVEASFLTPDELRICGKKWNVDTVIEIDLSQSTQFLTGFILSATALNQKITVKLKHQNQSSGYEEITWDLLRRLGFLVIEKEENIYTFENTEKINLDFEVGADWSSIFYIALFSFLNSEITITNVDFKSPEPDRAGIEILKACGLKYKVSDRTLSIMPSDFFLCDEAFDFCKNPDLFPGFCALLSWALPQAQKDYNLKLQFPWQLKLKESDRLNLSLDMLSRAGLNFEVKNDLIHLAGSFEKPSADQGTEPAAFPEAVNFNTGDDHRMLMSAHFLRAAGWQFDLSDENSHKKSFPEFMEIIYG